MLTSGQLGELFEIAPISSWSSPPRTLILGSDEVHVWRAVLDLKASGVQSLQQTLSEDERARAERFHFQKDRERFTVGRGMLRVILGRYLNKEPGQLRFYYGRHGKPSLARESGDDELRFNMSHSYGLALFAITQGREIGVDLEPIRTDLPHEEIAERFFTPREVAALRVLSASVQPQAFFNCWTRKEAYIKARGEGLTVRLDQFDVSLAPGEPAALLYNSRDLQEVCRWSLQELVPWPGYVAALAVEGAGWRLKCWQWPE